MEPIKFEAHEVKDKIVVVYDTRFEEEEMVKVSQVMKKAGAIEVIFSQTKLEALTEDDLKMAGLCRIGEENGKKSKSSKVEKPKERKAQKRQKEQKVS